MATRVSFCHNWQGERAAGWSENYFHQSNDPQTALADALKLAPFVKAVHGDQSLLVQIRVAALTAPKLSLVKIVDSTPPTEFEEATGSDFPSAAVTQELVGSDGRRIRNWIRGIPDKAIGKGGRKDFSTAYNRALKALKCELVAEASPWRIIHRDYAQAKKRITAITDAGVVTCAAHGYADGSKVRVSGCITPTQANGVWEAIVVDANTFKLEGYITLSGSVLTGKPRVKLLVAAEPVKIVDVMQKYASSRNVGRPFGQVGGRRRTRKKLQAGSGAVS